MNNHFIEVYIVTHKQLDFSPEESYIPMMPEVFKNTEENISLNYISNNTGDNIANKHNLYGEFTVVYWMWKNTNSKIIGENHYRRFFIEDSWIKYYLSYFITNKRKYILTKEKINQIMEDGFDCILPKKQTHFGITLRKQFIIDHGGTILDKAKEVISINFPAYLNTFERVMRAEKNYQKSIFIMKREWFDDYSQWLFDILSQLEKYVTQERELAFLAERLLNVWIEYNSKHNNLRIRETFFVNTDEKIFSYKHRRCDLFYPKWYIYTLGQRWKLFRFLKYGKADKIKEK